MLYVFTTLGQVLYSHIGKAIQYIIMCVELGTYRLELVVTTYNEVAFLRGSN